MKQLFFLSFIAILFVACNNDETEKVNINDAKSESVKIDYIVNTSESVLNWKGSMIGVYTHEGTLNFFDGNFAVKDGQIENGSFSVDMKSMLTTDDDALYANAPREKLIAHLQAEDFFNLESFPTASFTVTSSKGNKLTGNLTIRGITNTEEVTDVVISENNGILTANGNLVFDRQKYDVKYENKMGDMVLSDDIELTISLKGKSK